MNDLLYSSFDLIVILGPTASGKTKLAVELADNLSGEIISADSRQVYKGMDIGTGKDIDEYTLAGNKINYHLIDILSPMEEYNVSKFQKDFNKAILKIKDRKKLPILCGGTGLYIKAILLDYNIPQVEPNIKLRKNLENFTTKELIDKLNKISLQESIKTPLDTRRRIIRAIEVAMTKENKINWNYKKSVIKHPLIFGIYYSRKIIRDRITKRLMERLNNGMIEEVKSLINSGITHDRLDSFGLEYRFINQFILGKTSKDEMITKLNVAIHQYAKKQMTFFRNMEKNGIKINWIKEGDLDNILNIINSKTNT